MRNKKKSSFNNYKTKYIIALAILPLILIYILVEKPRFSFINKVSNSFIPIIDTASNIVSWPFRAIGNGIENFRELGNIRSKNDELTMLLLETNKKQNKYDIAIEENKLLKKQLDIIENMESRAIYANISYDNTAFHKSSFFINKGSKQGIKENMIVLSFDEKLLGIVSNVGTGYAKVRGLNDVKSKIPVRFAGSEIYGFLTGNGTDKPEIEFISDTEFQPTSGLKITTKSINGIIPNGIFVGITDSGNSVNVLPPRKVSDVIILEFNFGDGYK